MSVLSESVLAGEFVDECVRALEAVLAETLAQTKPWFGLMPVLVVGCSTSEAGGGQIGTAAHADLGSALAKTVLTFCQANGIHLAAQCCEHLNRALVVSGETMRTLNLTRVLAVPTPEAGGSFASAVFGLVQNAVLVREIGADMGVDIGGTLIGMHMKRVAVPVRLTLRSVGGARVTAAFSRPEYTGGARTCYTLCT